MTLVHGKFIAKVLNNPRWRQAFTIRRHSVAVNDKGRSEVTEGGTEASGVIQPASPEELEMLPEGERVGENIAIYAMTTLTAGNEDGQVDVIIWRGKEYRVKAMEDWRDYGYCKAVATLVDVRGKNA